MHTLLSNTSYQKAKWSHPAGSGGLISLQLLLLVHPSFLQSLNALTGQFSGRGSGCRATDLKQTYTAQKVKA